MIDGRTGGQGQYVIPGLDPGTPAPWDHARGSSAFPLARGPRVKPTAVRFDFFSDFRDFVMAGLDPAIHAVPPPQVVGSRVLKLHGRRQVSRVDDRVKPGHDERGTVERTGQPWDKPAEDVLLPDVHPQ